MRVDQHGGLTPRASGTSDPVEDPDQAGVDPGREHSGTRAMPLPSLALLEGLS